MIFHIILSTFRDLRPSNSLSNYPTNPTALPYARSSLRLAQDYTHAKAPVGLVGWLDHAQSLVWPRLRSNLRPVGSVGPRKPPLALILVIPGWVGGGLARSKVGSRGPGAGLAARPQTQVTGQGRREAERRCSVALDAGDSWSDGRTARGATRAPGWPSQAWIGFGRERAPRRPSPVRLRLQQGQTPPAG